MSYFNNNSNSKLSDEELIKKYRFSHNNMYIGELFLRYTPYIIGVALKHLQNQKDAEDLTLTTFNKVSSDLKRIDITNFKSWLYKLITDQCQIEKKKKTATDEDAKLILIEELSIENPNYFINTNGAQSNIDSNSLRLAIDTLNESQKVCIDLFYIQNKSYQEVADITGYTVNQVKTNIQNGKRLLKTYIENRSN